MGWKRWAWTGSPRQGRARVPGLVARSGLPGAPRTQQEPPESGRPPPKLAWARLFVVWVGWGGGSRKCGAMDGGKEADTWSQVEQSIKRMGAGRSSLRRLIHTFAGCTHPQQPSVSSAIHAPLTPHQAGARLGVWMGIERRPDRSPHASAFCHVAAVCDELARRPSRSIIARRHRESGCFCGRAARIAPSFGASGHARGKLWIGNRSMRATIRHGRIDPSIVGGSENVDRCVVWGFGIVQGEERALEQRRGAPRACVPMEAQDASRRPLSQTSIQCSPCLKSINSPCFLSFFLYRRCNAFDADALVFSSSFSLFILGVVVSFLGLCLLAEYGQEPTAPTHHRIEDFT